MSATCGANGHDYSGEPVTVRHYPIGAPVGIFACACGSEFARPLYCDHPDCPRYTPHHNVARAIAWADGGQRFAVAEREATS